MIKTEIFRDVITGYWLKIYINDKLLFKVKTFEEISNMIEEVYNIGYQDGLFKTDELWRQHNV